jgi:hypothetical protein
VSARLSRPSEDVTSRIADEHHERLAGGHEADERRDLEDRLDAVEAREAGLEDLPHDEDEHGGAERVEDPPPVGGQVGDHARLLASRPTKVPRTTATTRNKPW